MRNFLIEFLESQGYSANWEIPTDQPMHLHILSSLCRIMDDKDTTLFPYLTGGVPVGIEETISRSFCFPPSKPKNPDENPLLSIHHCNWQSAEDNPEDVSSLIQKEIDEQWVEEFHGSLEDAQERWPKGVAVGKLGLALSDSRPPRLVLDSTICGVNGRCVIPEHATLPSAQDVKRCYPLRNNSKPLSGFSLDIRSAHKRIAVKEPDRGFHCSNSKIDIFIIRFVLLEQYFQHIIGHAWAEHFYDSFTCCASWPMQDSSSWTIS